MGFREYINQIDKEGILQKINVEVSKKLEIPGILKEIAKKLDQALSIQ